MQFHKTLVKAALLKIMKLIETHSDYYMARGNEFYPFINPIAGIRTSQPCELNPKDVWAKGMDKVQHGLMQLISHEIYQRNIEGAIAEIGTYQGFSASVMNYFFPDRKIYLFDTFQGFDRRDLEVEEKLGFNSKGYDDFSNTSRELVMAKMTHKHNVMIRKGWFPESAVGLEGEKFCFVFIDADLYQPIYEGLHWFYPRLSNGGYIVVDDYNWNDYPGAKKAVEDFSKEVGICFIPIPTTTGSVVFGKPLIF
jgi:O-methyltransferase